MSKVKPNSKMRKRRVIIVLSKLAGMKIQPSPRLYKLAKKEIGRDNNSL